MGRRLQRAQCLKKGPGNAVVVLAAGALVRTEPGLPFPDRLYDSLIQSGTDPEPCPSD